MGPDVGTEARTDNFSLTVLLFLAPPPPADT